MINTIQNCNEIIIDSLHGYWISFFILQDLFFLGLNSGTTRRDNLLLRCLDPFTKFIWSRKSSTLFKNSSITSIVIFGSWCGDRRDILSLLGSQVCPLH